MPSVRIFACTFNNNSAQGGASQEGGGAVSGNIGNSGVSGGIAEGGAICNLGTNTAVNCTFDENAARVVREELAVPAVTRAAREALAAMLMAAACSTAVW